MKQMNSSDNTSRQWNFYYGNWWAIQWCFDGWFSLGIHIDTKCRKTALTKIRYGPYIDLHLGFFVVSFGVRPAYAGDLDLKVSTARSGINGDNH